MSSVQFNLLPDVKLRYIKGQKIRNRVVSVAVLVSGALLAIFILMLAITYGIQKKQLSDASKQITNSTKDLEAIPSLNQALTVHNQLGTLVDLHDSKHVSSLLFIYLSQVTPTNASLSNLDIDFAANQLTINGTADSQAAVNAFADNLKFAKYSVGSSSPQTAFLSVLESSFSINPSNVSYTLSVEFDPNLFTNEAKDDQGNHQAPVLTVSSQPARSSDSLFNSQAEGQ